MAATDKPNPVKMSLSIRQSSLDFKYIFIKNYNDYLIKIAYRSPSIFLDGIYLTIPLDVIKHSKLYNSVNRRQKFILIRNESAIIKEWCSLILKINNVLKNAVIGDNICDELEISSCDYIDKLWNSSEKTAPPLKSKSEKFKPFMKAHKLATGEEIFMLIVNNYELDEIDDNFNMTERPIIFQLSEINKRYNNYYCSTTLNYKYL